jgi:CheY-like chemotaxis protein
MALSMVHSIVAEHNGYLSAQPAAADAWKIEILLPHAGSAAPFGTGSGPVPAVLLVEERESVRSQLHKFFEEHGYDLVEACDAEEAVAIGMVHEGPIDVVIAKEGLDLQLGGAAVLRIVDRAESAPAEIRAPFTQQALLDRVEAVLKQKGTTA